MSAPVEAQAHSAIRQCASAHLLKDGMTLCPFAVIIFATIPFISRLNLPAKSAVGCIRLRAVLNFHGLSSAARAVVAVEAAATCIRHNGCILFSPHSGIGVYAPVIPRSA
jgi:Na+/H+-translocating membrane pyrophosphatase